MNVLMIIGIVLASILLLIVVALFLPIGIIIKVDNENGFSFFIKFLGKKFGGQSSSKSDNLFVKGVKKAVGISHLDSAKTIKNAIVNRGTTGTLKETADVLLAILNRVIWALKRCKIKRCEVTSISAGENASIDYGTACAVIYPIIGYVKSNFRVNERKVNANIVCDYLNDESSYDINVELRIRVFRVVSALFYVVKQNLETRGVL